MERNFFVNDKRLSKGIRVLFYDDDNTEKYSRSYPNTHCLLPSVVWWKKEQFRHWNYICSPSSAHFLCELGLMDICCAWCPALGPLPYVQGIPFGMDLIEIQSHLLLKKKYFTGLSLSSLP